MLILDSHRHDRLADVDARDRAERLAEGAAHARLQAIGAGARQHLVDADDVERVHAHANVERVLADELDEVFVGANTRRLERFGRELLILVRDQVHDERELVHTSLLTTQVEYADLWVFSSKAFTFILHSQTLLNPSYIN